MDYRTLRKLAIAFGLVIHVQAQVFLVGTTLKLPCNVPESFSEFTWKNSGTVIAGVKKGSSQVTQSDPRVSVDENENLGELSIRDIVFHDAGVYSCTVEFSDRIPQITEYTVYIVESTSKPPSTTVTTRVAVSSTVSADSGTQSTNGKPIMLLTYQLTDYQFNYDNRLFIWLEIGIKSFSWLLCVLQGNTRK